MGPRPDLAAGKMNDEEFRQLQQKYRLGFALARIDDLTLGHLPQDLRTRKWNKREQSDMAVADLWSKGFDEGKGIAANNPKHAIILSISPRYIKTSTLEPHADSLTFPHLEFIDGPMQVGSTEVGDVLNGMHRIYAMQNHALQDLLADKAQTYKDQEHADPSTPKGFAAYQKCQKKLEEIEAKLEIDALWLCEIYDHG